MTAEERYREAFGLGENGDHEKAKVALEHALDIRKFEIGLYWQRATYAWTLIAATFAGYFAVLSVQGMVDKDFYAYVLGCMGVVFSLAWLLINRGSKYWQENWERHVDMLEDTIAGPLYKTVLHRPESAKGWEKAVIGPAPYSVSQVNQWLSIFTIVIWVVLLWNVLPAFDASAGVSGKHVVVGMITLAAALVLWFGAKSNIVVGHQQSVMKQRAGVIDG